GCNRIADLVSGDWVREELGVENGPSIGELLKKLRDAEIEGRVSDAGEARRFLRQQAAK
ncbi:MAG: hypothetical protein GWN87_28295, partial [Desulfuromonadales bacterium]|nr:hypothetical protein [Desulfuromonadales bacterium]NIS43575.1 hypothetical protein [Desulfuromonadales bacterium]